MLQTRPPTGKTLGPSFTLLLSSPITSQVSGDTVSWAGAALAGTAIAASMTATLVVLPAWLKLAAPKRSAAA